MSLFEEPRKTRTTVYLDPEHLEAIERIRELAGNGANRSQVVRYALERGLKNIEARLRKEQEVQKADELQAAYEHAKQGELANNPGGAWIDEAVGELGELRDVANDPDAPTEDERMLHEYRVFRRAWELRDADEADAHTSSHTRRR